MRLRHHASASFGIYTGGKSLLVEVKNLDISYTDTPEPLVKNVSLSLDKGEVLTIVGESGSGKTTVIRAILGVLSGTGYISNGSIHFAGQDLTHLSNQEWLKLRGKNISMIFQDCGNMMNPVQTIGHQYIEYIQTHADKSKEEAKAMALEVLTRMNLPDPENIMNSYIFELSGGMRQRVGIARALAIEPDLLLMDEPFSALDAQTRTIMQEELVTLWEKTRLTTLYVTHNIQEAVMLADRVVLLSRRPGKVSKILQIDIPRADRAKTEHTDEIAEFVRIIWEHISKDARAALMEVEDNA